jgi:hypothetical protein
MLASALLCSGSFYSLDALQQWLSEVASLEWWAATQRGRGRCPAHQCSGMRPAEPGRDAVSLKTLPPGFSGGISLEFF